MLFRGGSETREDEWEGNKGQDPAPAPPRQVILNIHKLKNFFYKIICGLSHRWICILLDLSSLSITLFNFILAILFFSYIL